MSDNQTKADHPIEELLARRWSPVTFDTRPVEAAKLRSLLEAARWAPSSYNEQPWAFVVTTSDDEAAFARALGCLVEGNIAWAQHAPVLVLSVAKSAFERNGKPNRHVAHDVGLAVGNLLVQATALDLVVHQMAGFFVDKAREAFAVPDGWEPLTMFALGYLGSGGELPENVLARQQGPRTRKPLASFVFSGRWGKSASLLED